MEWLEWLRLGNLSKHRVLTLGVTTLECALYKYIVLAKFQRNCYTDFADSVFFVTLLWCQMDNIILQRPCQRLARTGIPVALNFNICSILKRIFMGVQSNNRDIRPCMYKLADQLPKWIYTKLHCMPISHHFGFNTVDIAGSRIGRIGSTMDVC